MILDKELMFSEKQAVTASAASTNVIDMGTDRELGAADVEVYGIVDEAATAAGAATVQVALETDDNSGFSTPTTLSQTAAIGKATLVAGYKFFRMKIPYGCERFLRLYYTVATGPLTAGKFTAGIVLNSEVIKAYPDAT